jgi:hypothetical protein
MMHALNASGSNDCVMDGDDGIRISSVNRSTGTVLSQVQYSHCEY